MLEVKDATIRVGDKTLMSGLSFIAKDGQMTCVKGSSGSGKPGTGWACADSAVFSPMEYSRMLRMGKACGADVAEIRSVVGRDTLVKRFVLLDGRRRETKLSKRELAVLRHFADHPNEQVAKEDLLRRVWGMENLERIESRVHDTLIWGLREKLGGDKDVIETVHGIGWRYRA